MAYKFQLLDLKRSTVRNIAGVCVDSQDFIDIANEVQRRLMRRGNWDDTAWTVRLCVYDGCVTWPHYVHTVLGARFCDGQVAALKNNWYSITGNVAGYSQFTASSFPLRDVNNYAQIVFEDAGRGPTYNPINVSTGLLIRYYVKYFNDIGKTITIYGKAAGGQTLQHLDANGNWIDGLVLTATAPYATTSVYVREITSVVREATQGVSYLYAYNPTTDKLLDLAVYEPNETNPNYRKTRINNFCLAGGCRETITVGGVDYNRNKSVIEALVKLETFDLVNDQDFLMIDNFDAFKHGFQAVKLSEANDLAAAEAHWILAIRELNFDLRDRSPIIATPVFVNATNSNLSLSNPI